MQEGVRSGLRNPYNLGCLGVVGFLLFAVVVAAIIGGVRNSDGSAGNSGGAVAEKSKQEDVEPKLVISSPSESPTVTKDSIEVNGKVTPANAKVTVNGQDISTDGDGSFTTSFHLNVGENYIQISAEKGSEDAEASRTVTREPSEKEGATQEAAEENAKKQEPQPQQEKQQAKARQKEQQDGGQKPEPPKPSVASFGDGTYQVGTDVQPGIYRTRAGSPNCYWERLRTFSGGLNGILANGNTSAPAIVTIEQTDAGFHSEGCGTWTKDLSAITASKTSFGAGAYIVGTDIVPGTYRNSGGANCYYERLRGFNGGLNAIIANGNTSNPTIVTIAPPDAGFQSNGCGTWTKLE